MRLEDREAFPIIWVHEYQVYGTILTMGAYFSTVQFSYGGILYETVMENDEFEVIDEINIGYEEEE